MDLEVSYFQTKLFLPTDFLGIPHNNNMYQPSSIPGWENGVFFMAHQLMMISPRDLGDLVMKLDQSL
jgi:hypothetical protein